MFTIYALVDPDTGRDRYIGVTKRTIEFRLKNHTYYAKIGRKTYCSNWIRSLDKTPAIRVVDVEKTLTDANFAEQIYILLYRLLGESLVNVTWGGEGMSGYKMTTEQCNNISIGRRKGKIAQQPKVKGPYKGRTEYGSGYRRRLARQKAITNEQTPPVQGETSPAVETPAS